MPDSSLRGAPQDVVDTYQSYRSEVQGPILEMRELILETAAETPGVGPLTETLKWGQPAYVTHETRSGSTVRLAQTRAESEHDFAMYFICHTNLVQDFRAQFGDTFEYDGDRGLLFSASDDVPTAQLRECVSMALTYHLARR